MTTTNFSDVLAGRSNNFAEHPAMQREEIATDRQEPSNIIANQTGDGSLDKLDALE